MSSTPEWLTDEQREQLSECRQGDVVLSLRGQVWLAHGDLPTTEHARANAREGQLSGMYEAAPHGHAILTQTCDLVPRPGRDRPFVALAPLVQLDDDDASQGRRGRMTRYAHVPAFDDGSYFADLDRITTVETGALLLQERTAGLSDDEQRKAFARAVARKFGRFAFPDDLYESLSKWRKHVVAKYDREHSPEGTLYRKAEDVRISATPAWDADTISVVVTVLFQPGFLPPIDPEAVQEVGDVAEVSGLSAAEIAQQMCDGIADPGRSVLLCERLQRLWSEQCDCVGMVGAIDFELVGADEMTVDSYLRSFSFDLEFLSPA